MKHEQDATFLSIFRKQQKKKLLGNENDKRKNYYKSWKQIEDNSQKV